MEAVREGGCQGRGHVRVAGLQVEVAGGETEGGDVVWTEAPVS